MGSLLQSTHCRPKSKEHCRKKTQNVFNVKYCFSGSCRLIADLNQRNTVVKNPKCFQCKVLFFRVLSILL